MAKRRFNINGLCLPDEHYMVDLASRLAQIKEMVDRGDYFCINRGRQYGKTTILRALREYLKEEYVIVPLSFEGLGNSAFATEDGFARSFARLLLDRTAKNGQKEREKAGLDIVREFIESDKEKSFLSLSSLITKICGAFTRPCVILIDEVDQASNFEVFVGFLSALRELYLNRDNPKEKSTFRSVILAGVHDIRHLKSKIRPESEHKLNSPWNIAAQYKVDMSFSTGDIAGMLRQYEADHNTGMDVEAVADELHNYTSGYPVMVCWLCKYMDEDLRKWDRAAVEEAAKVMTSSFGVDVFGSMSHQLGLHPDLLGLLIDIVVNDKRVPSKQEDYVQSLGLMFCYLKEDGTRVKVANRIFEMYIMRNYDDEVDGADTTYEGNMDEAEVVEGGRLNMDLVLERFQRHFTEVFSDRDSRFVEEKGRKLFLLYVRPIINGVGNYYIEPQTRDLTRADMVIDYRGERFVVEMKIWRGESYNRRGEEQLAGYLDRFGLKKGYMLSFCFNRDKQPGLRTVRVGDREILEAVV